MCARFHRLIDAFNGPLESTSASRLLEHGHHTYLMNQQPPKACLRCSKAFDGPGYSCPDCKKPQPTANPQSPNPPTVSKYDHKREWSPLYDQARWRNPQYGLKAACLRKNPICMICNRAPSKVVHHVIDHRGDLKLFFDFSNLQALCKACHDRITGKTHGFGRQPSGAGPACLVDGKIRQGP